MAILLDAIQWVALWFFACAAVVLVGIVLSAQVRFWWFRRQEQQRREAERVARIRAEARR